MLGKLLAILHKDILFATSYRLGFAIQLVGPFFLIVSFFFLSRLVEGSSLVSLERYGGDYFSFALIGLAFATYTGIFLGTVVATIRSGQTLGTLEIVLTTQTSLTTYLVGSSLYGLLRGSIMVIIFLGIATMVFGADFGNANWPAAGLVVLLSAGMVLGLGIISGGLILLFKQGDPLSMAVNAGVFLVSGVVYPVDVLPAWLKVTSLALPHTYALEALRLAMLQGASTVQLAPQIIPLFMFSLGIFLFSLVFFKYSQQRARVEGSFSQY